jgi:hypothetical protein
MPRIVPLLVERAHAPPRAALPVGVFGGDVKFNGGQAASSATVSFFQVGASLTRR